MTMSDIFLRLPSPTALLLLSTILDLTQARTLPLPPQTRTVDHRQLDVIAWPPLPTSPPIDLAHLNELRRRQDTNTVCGFIGGDPGLPATCSAGSHCVLDTEHGAVGCCPNGQETCTTGVFTGCVDFNSGPQTEINPYVFTCQGSDVCYRNVFDGGFFQPRDANQYQPKHGYEELYASQSDDSSFVFDCVCLDIIRCDDLTVVLIFHHLFIHDGKPDFISIIRHAFEYYFDSACGFIPNGRKALLG
ncbi:hypothetical protein NKR23_g9895 [Pleurostoma richardsiae]|uniref:Uncharacterized protein n=1 Tax=Pleurostoma richardsiae TaxID=41990 RepID=A0AA38RM34_9PEZI|nr:hypothetical protein NKR23_g9895 [Pleurostoma richardsiae]